MLVINRKSLRKKSQGSALLIVSFLSIIAAIITVSMMNLSSSNTRQISNDLDGKNAYYAAESGLSEVKNYFNSSFLNWGVSFDTAALPKESSPAELSNGATYWIDNLSYINSNKTALVDIIGKYKGAYRKIRAQIITTIPKFFDDYGLLTDGVLRINGNKTLNMSIHGNDGLILKGSTKMDDDVVATQSVNPDAESPDPSTNPIGGYVEPLDVPMVPIDDLRTQAQSGIVFDVNRPDINTQLMSAPAGSIIYLYDPTGSGTVKNLTISGDMQSKIIFVDSNIVVNADGISNLSNVMIISAGGLTVNGTVDIVSAHSGKLDVVFASNDNITLNGSRKFKSLFWTNGNFTQNGSSMAGRVIAQNGITFNGNFTLTASEKLFDFGNFNNVASVSSWQQIPME